MELYIGGVGQGKISYVRQKYGFLEEEIWDGRKENEMPLINHLMQVAERRRVKYETGR